MGNPQVSAENKLRVVLLYALRYEKEATNRIRRFTEQLPEQMQRLVPLVLQNYGSARRSGDLFSNKSWLAVTKKAMQKSIKGVANVYTQHTPYLAATLEAISKGLLSEGAFPEVGGGGAGAGGAAGGAATKRRAPTEIIVFVVGGITYEEARYVAEMNSANPGVRIILGGTTVHNCGSFIDEIGRDGISDESKSTNDKMSSDVRSSGRGVCPSTNL